MARDYFPFSKGVGKDSGVKRWTKMGKHFIATGVLSDFLVKGDSTGMQVKVNRGYAWIQGHYYEETTEVVLPIASSDTSNPRIDRVVILLDWNEETIQLAVLQGVPAVSPVAPALTQNDARWEIQLAQVRVEAGVSTIAADKVFDGRNFVGNANVFQEEWKPLVTQNGWYSDPDLPAQYYLDSTLRVQFRGKLVPGILTSGIAPFTMPSGYRPVDQMADSMIKIAAPDGSLEQTTLQVKTDGVAAVLNNMNIGFIQLDGYSYRVV